MSDDGSLASRVHRLADEHQETRMQTREGAMRLTMLEQKFTRLEATTVTATQFQGLSDTLTLKFKSLTESIDAVQDVIRKVAWFIVAAVLTALLGLVVVRPWIVIPPAGQQPFPKP